MEPFATEIHRRIIAEYAQRAEWLVNADVEWNGDQATLSEQEWDLSPPRLWRVNGIAAKSFTPAMYVCLDLVQMIDPDHRPSPGDRWDRSRVKVFDVSTVDREKSPERIRALSRYDRDQQATMIRTPRAYRPTGWIDVPQVKAKSLAIELLGQIGAIDASTAMARVAMMTTEEDDELLALWSRFDAVQAATNASERDQATESLASLISEYGRRHLGASTSDSSASMLAKYLSP